MTDGREKSHWTPEVMADEGAGATGEGARAAKAEGSASEIEDLRRQLDEKHDRLLRAVAEVDNVKRRTQRERDEYVRYANESLVRDLLPVLDNFDRALEAARGARE